ncbi:MAG: phosphoribosyl-AMP cyclohydrolase [Pseudomonadales bacterium]
MFQELESAPVDSVRPLAEVLGHIRFNADGLVPAVAQDAGSREVLMLAWMNRAAIERTLAEGYACYYSRSRATLWRKGETSGHLQALRELRLDCDGDAILLLVEQTGPACHTNRPSCFYLKVEGQQVRVTTAPQ